LANEPESQPAASIFSAIANLLITMLQLRAMPVVFNTFAGWTTKNPIHIKRLWPIEIPPARSAWNFVTLYQDGHG
jgi:hypothetical protein